METVKKYLKRYFIDAMSAMALGLFASLLMGTIFGTVAKYVAYHNIDVVDVGVPVLSMHAPYEVISKIDLYMAYKGFLTFFTK